MNARARWRRDDRERGSVALEAVVIAPALLLLIVMVIAGGRLALAKQSVEAAASDAARSASIARTPGEAASAGAKAARASLANEELRCASQSAAVDAAAFAAPVGAPAQISATVTCAVNLSDLSVPGIPGTYTATSTMTSPIDTYRER